MDVYVGVSWGNKASQSQRAFLSPQKAELSHLLRYAPGMQQSLALISSSADLTGTSRADSPSQLSSHLAQTCTRPSFKDSLANCQINICKAF